MALYGYKIKDGKACIDKEKAANVQKLFDGYINGLALRTAALEAGIDTVHGSAGRMLKNKKYIGTYTYNGIETKDAIPRIISDELFNKVQLELVRNGLAPSRSRAKNEYLFV